MTNDQILSMARAALNILGTILLTYGYIKGLDAETWSTISGAVLTLVGVGWGLFAHTKTNTVTAAAKLLEVEQIVATPAFAGKIPDPKVVDARQRRHERRT